jgi:hypothetical protein
MDKLLTANWVPLDERWDNETALNFVMRVLPNALRMMMGGAAARRQWGDTCDSHFKSFAELDSIYAQPGASAVFKDKKIARRLPLASQKQESVRIPKSLMLKPNKKKI